MASGAPIDLDAAVAAQKRQAREEATAQRAKTNGHKPNGNGAHVEPHAANGADPGTRHGHDDDDALFYRMEELKDETALPPDERRAIWLVEHAEDCDALNAWGMVATAYNRGVGWTKDHDEVLRGSEIVISFDRGHEKHGGTIAAALYGKALRIKIIDWAKVWPACPNNAGMAAWIERGGGTAAGLFAFVERLPVWAPPPFQSSLGAVSWDDLDKPRDPPEWLVDDFIPARSTILAYGDTQTGKSFCISDLSACVARGAKFFGMDTKQCGVIYCAFEAGEGFPHRMYGYKLYHEINYSIPFAIITHRVNILSDDEKIAVLKKEIEQISKSFSPALGLIVFDTISASSAGMRGNDGEDVGKYIGKCIDICAPYKASAIFVHHKPKGGESPLGSVKFQTDLDTNIQFDYDPNGEKDAHGRPFRVAKVTKQREGESGKSIRFVLGSVETGKRPNGKPVTTAIVLPMDGSVPAEKRRQGYNLRDYEAIFFKAVLQALNKYGKVRPDVPEVPQDMRAVEYEEVKKIYVDLNPWDVPADDKDSAEEIKKKHYGMLRTRLHRCRTQLSHPLANVIGASKGLIWWSGRPVKGFPETQPRILTPKKLAPLPDDVGDLIG